MLTLMNPGSKTAQRKFGKIRVLIADDHVTVLEGLSAIIGRQSDMKIVAQASDGREAVDLWNKNLPDIALLDLRMPTLDGTGAIIEIRRSFPDARIIALTTYDTDNEISQAIAAGAKGYLLKDAPIETLLQWIRNVNKGETCIPAGIVSKLAASMSREVLERILHFSGGEIGA